MTDEGWSRRLRAGVVEFDEADRDEQKRQEGDDSAHARQCTTNQSGAFVEFIVGAAPVAAPGWVTLGWPRRATPTKLFRKCYFVCYNARNVIPRTVPTTALTFLILASCLCAFGQESGRLKGVVRTSSGGPAAGVVVIITNQVTRKIRRVKTNTEGSYTVSWPAGADRLNLDQPNTAQF